MQLQRWNLEQLNSASCIQLYISISDGLPQKVQVSVSDTGVEETLQWISTIKGKCVAYRLFTNTLLLHFETSLEIAFHYSTLKGTQEPHSSVRSSVFSCYPA